MKRGAGYIAIDRGIFEHWIARNAKRFRAWQWMIADAAFAPRGKRGTWGVVHLERGQLVGSEWMLAARWRWSRPAVNRFLQRLERAGMIARLTTRTVDGRAVPVDATISEQPTEQPTVPHLEHDVTVITICNYDAFNKVGAAQKTQASNQPSNRPESASAQTQMFAGFCEPLTTKPSDQRLESKGPIGIGEVIQAKTPPRHETQSYKHGTVYLHRGTKEWDLYAEDYRSVLGVEPMPEAGGPGKWFYGLGEAARPKHQRHWRKVRFGPAPQPKPVVVAAAPSPALLQSKIIKGAADAG